MKILYIMAAVMLIGALMMIVASHQILSGIEVSKEKQVVLRPDLKPYVAVSYLGITLFVVGAVGSLIVLLKSINRRV